MRILRSAGRSKGARQQSSSETALSIEEWSDDSLIEAIITKQVEALEVLYQRYHQLSYSLAYRMVTDHQVAEDLLQETFFSVWRHATSYTSSSGSVRTWLFSIMHHRTIEYLRSVQRRVALSKLTLDDVEQDGGIATPDAWDETWRNVQGIRVREALLKIPKEQRLVIELAYFQGWTHVEIAEGCQLPLGTVKARMRLGLQHMRRLLVEMGVDEP
jgi:RNA polymerase sigma factor (sigma-70 family)